MKQTNLANEATTATYAFLPKMKCKREGVKEERNEDRTVTEARGQGHFLEVSGKLAK